MISTDGRKQVAWMPDNNDSIRPQSREDESPVTVKNLTKNDVEEILRQVAATASTMPREKINLDKIIKRNEGLTREITQCLKAYK